MEQIRRSGDDELCGFISLNDGNWTAHTVFGGVLAEGLDRVAAEALVREIGLTSLSDRWQYRASSEADWQTVLIIEASPQSVTLALGYYSLPGVETVRLSAELIVEQRLLVRDHDGSCRDRILGQ